MANAREETGKFRSERDAYLVNLQDSDEDLADKRLRKVERHGKVYEQNTANIGKSNANEATQTKRRKSKPTSLTTNPKTTSHATLPLARSCVALLTSAKPKSNQITGKDSSHLGKFPR
jgi:hypothetical protein